MKVVSRILSVHQEHEVLRALEAAGLVKQLAQVIIESKNNKLALDVVGLLTRGGQESTVRSSLHSLKNLDFNLFQDLYFEQWVTVFDKVPRGAEMEVFALLEMISKADSFHEWEQVLERTSAYKELQTLSLEKMFEFDYPAVEAEDEVFYGWHSVYQRYPKGSEVRNRAFNKMLNSDALVFEWHDAYDSVDDKHKDLILVRINRLSDCFGEYVMLYDIAPKDSEYRRISLESMSRCDVPSSELVDTPFQGWDNVVDEHSGDDEIVALALDRISSFNRPFEDWQNLYDPSLGDCETNSIAIVKMLEADCSLDQWRAVFGNKSSDEAVKKYATTKLSNVEWSFFIWKEFLDTVDDIKMKEFALVKMTSLAESDAEIELLHDCTEQVNNS